VQWLSQRLNRALSTEDELNLGKLADMPGWRLMEWLKRDMNFTSESITASASPGNFRNQRVHTVRPYHVRCLDSNDRYHQKRMRSRGPKVFECTNGCGQSFPRGENGEWKRHERMNFEDWICPHCAHSLSRKDHLKDHLKKKHSIEAINLDQINLDQYRHQFLSPSERPCGFCSEIFHD
jgi:hypothetical protein